MKNAPTLNSQFSTLNSPLTPSVPPGYKQTEVGVIPEDWEDTPLGNYVKITSGESPSQIDFSDSGIPYFKVEQLSNSQKYLNIYSTPYYFEKGKTIPSGSVVFAKRGAAIALNKVRISNCQAFMDTNLMALTPNDELDCEYLYYKLGHIGLWRFADTTSVPQINNKHINPLVFPIPKIEEQRAIAKALSDVDALLEGLDRLLAKKRDLKQATMQALLTPPERMKNGKWTIENEGLSGENGCAEISQSSTLNSPSKNTRLPGFEGEWEVKRLGDVGHCLRGVSYRGDSDLSTHDTAHTKRLLRSNNVQAANVVISEVQYVNTARVSPNQVLIKNDVLVCMANGSKALVGKAGFFAVADGYEYTFGAFMGCFRTDASTADPRFVFTLFQTGSYRDYINNLLAGSSINNLRPSSIESLEFSMPPLHEQTAIAAVLSDMDTEIESLEKRRTKTADLKQAMMQELLTGRIRIV